MAIWQINYDPLGENDNTFEMGDFDGDGKIDGSDLALWQLNYDPVGSGDIVESAPIADEVMKAVSVPVPQVGTSEPITPSTAVGVSGIGDKPAVVTMSAIASTRFRGRTVLFQQEDSIDVLAITKLDVTLVV